MLENLLFILGILLYIGIFLNFLRTSLKGCGLNPAIFDFLFVSCSIFAVILPNPEQLEATPKVVVEQLRGGESSKNLNFAQKFVSFFIPSLYKPQPQPQPQCPALPQTSRTASLKFASGNGGDGSNSRSQNIPPSDKWESDEDFYKDFQRYQNRKNKNKDDEIETCDKDQTPIQGECRPRVLRSRINEDEGLIKAPEKACKNQQVQNDINAMEEQIRQGNMNPGIGSKQVGEGITEFRGKNGGRILARESENGVVEILGKSGKRPKNQQYVIDQAKKVFPKNKK